MSATDVTKPSSSEHRFRPTLLTRAALLGLVLLLEKYLLNLFVDTTRADAAHGFGAVVRVAQHIGFSFAITFALSLTFLVLVGGQRRLAELSDEARHLPLRAPWVYVHLALFAVLAASLTLWYAPNATQTPLWVLVSGSTVLAATAISSLMIGLAPLALWRRAAAALGSRWLFAAVTAAIATLAVSWSQTLWGWTGNLTFMLVRASLKPFVPSLHTEPSVRVLAANHFAVQVQAYCSGLEGIGLMLAFSSGWLVYFRREYIFPRALILMPSGVALIFCLNAVRIATLFLIGEAGFPATAIYGFHSEAGWIAFNIAAGGLALVSRSSVWLNRHAREHSRPTSNPTAAYLAPLLLFLVAGVVAHAMSGGFETWYGLRLIAAGFGLAFSWPRLTGIDWHFGWRGMSIGAVVFVLWLAAAHVSLERSGIPATLAGMTAPARILWMAVRTGTSLLVVPIVEELAFRGYLLRRLVAADFETVDWGAPGPAPLLLSSVPFAALHGALWWPALAAGLAYGLALRRTRRLGEAVAAHAVTNALLAIAVLGFGQWQLWP